MKLLVVNLRTAALMFAFASVLVAGCGKGGDKTAAANAATQVAVKVNAEEITVHQVNAALAKAPSLGAEAAERAKKEILRQLVDQELARQQAVDKKLDRSPAVLQALEAAKTEILARAYLDKIISAQPRPTAPEIKDYYAKHPELFAQRRLFALEEILVDCDDAVAAEIRDQVAKGKSAEDIGKWLGAKGIRFAENRGIRPAEQLPLDLLPRLQQAERGQTLFVEAGQRRNVVRVVGWTAEPVDETTATPRITQFLFNRRAADAVEREMKQVREHAKIQYMGEFAGAAAAPEAPKAGAAEAGKDNVDKAMRVLR